MALVLPVPRETNNNYSSKHSGGQDTSIGKFFSIYKVVQTTGGPERVKSRPRLTGQAVQLSTCLCHPDGGTSSPRTSSTCQATKSKALPLHREGHAFKNLHQVPCGLTVALLLKMLKANHWLFSAGAPWEAVPRNSMHVFLAAQNLVPKGLMAQHMA